MKRRRGVIIIYNDVIIVPSVCWDGSEETRGALIQYKGIILAVWVYYGKSHCGDKASVADFTGGKIHVFAILVVWSSYLHNGISYW